jgi:hypothetical protein
MLRSMGWLKTAKWSALVLAGSSPLAWSTTDGSVTDAGKNSVGQGSLIVGQQVANNVGVVASSQPGNASFDGSGLRRFALPGQTGAASAGRPPWSAWVALSRNDVAFNFAPRQSSGSVDVGMVGVDYTTASRMVLGVAVAGDRSDIALNFSGGNVRGSGWTIAPYIGVPLNRNWALDATVGYGRSDVDLRSGGATGSFRSERTIGAAGATYRSTLGNWLFSGRAGLLFANDRLGAYTLSNGTFISDGRVNVSQVRVGGQAGYNLGGVIPYVGLTYIHDLRRPDQQPVGGVSAANDRDAWTPTIGLRFSSGGSLYGGIQYSSEQSRSQVKNNQLLFNLGLRF